VSAERDEMDERHERSKALWEWLRSLRKTAPRETQIDIIRSRYDKATDADERRDLKDHLQILLHQTDRIDEALQLGDAWIAENPNDVYAYTCKSRTYLWVDDLDKALECVELAVACARRTGKWLRTALGYKARILVDMRNGEALADVLEEIMALKVGRDTFDMGRERDFVDAAPPGLIPRELLFRYDAFCPRPKGDSPDEIPPFDQPAFGPDGAEISVTRPRWPFDR
jgi:tetratricopeptide (TPR) repeat protein